MKTWVIAILLLVSGACSCHRPPSPYTPENIKKQKLANEIRKKVALQLKREKGLSPIGTIGQMLNEIQKLGLSFYYYKPVDIIEGRKLLIDSVSAMLDEINQDKRIHPFLIRCPFQPKNIEIEIFLWGPDRKEVLPGNLSLIKMADGNLYYKMKNPQRVGNLIVYIETYEQALERIADPSLPLVPFQLDPEISQEELVKLRKGISFAADDGSIWKLGDDGCWIKELTRNKLNHFTAPNQPKIDDRK